MPNLSRVLQMGAGLTLALTLMTGCSGASPEKEIGNDQAAAEAATKVQEKLAEAAQTAEPAEEPSTKDELAAKIQEGINANFPEGTEKPPLVAAITEYEPLTSSSVRLHVQESLTDVQRDEVAKYAFNLGAYKNPDLDIVVVRDATGLDSNHYR